MHPSLVRIDSADPTPLYAQIERAIRAAVATGRLPEGAQLPTVRQLAAELRVNANTVARVYSELARDGLVETRRGVGTFVGQSSEALFHQPNRQALRDFTSRVLEDAAARGFSRDDFIAQLQLQVKGEHDG